ncbi:conserved protein of unknown function [Nitrospira japonica]|uniref:Putative regulatory protein FmdB zinc ribbon domain-containing protein n=1 Tax=Nitrospira japonica TaxID=1325564 RepID=A0A1W1I946_9BACT|nr:FmdB family zinc ribbon protein [Nitrospira japonica]SLM49548.1 conserved protein of unknown function [Nitrospira japonica]
MPIYEYLCEGCAYKFEIKQSIKDDPIAACERCGKPVQRLISSPAIMFKGSGWYVTDYSDKLKPPSAGGESTADKKEPAPAAASTAAPTTSAPPSTNTSTGTSTSAPAPTSAPASTPSTTPSSK